MAMFSFRVSVVCASATFRQICPARRVALIRLTAPSHSPLLLQGWKASAFGCTGQHGPDAVDFYTQKKVVSERWFGAEVPKDGWV